MHSHVPLTAAATKATARDVDALRVGAQVIERRSHHAHPLPHHLVAHVPCVGPCKRGGHSRTTGASAEVDERAVARHELEDAQQLRVRRERLGKWPEEVRVLPVVVVTGGRGPEPCGGRELRSASKHGKRWPLLLPFRPRD